MLKRSFCFGVVFAAAIALGACAPAMSRGWNGEEEYAEADAAASVKVTNNGWSDVDMFLLRGSSRIRLGMVTSMSSQRFTVPASFLNGASDLRLHAHPIGGFNDFQTQPLLVSPGQQISLTLQNNLNLSSYSIY
jgi:hypothetical protein